VLVKWDDGQSSSLRFDQDRFDIVSGQQQRDAVAA
jgi:hypothetical protein